MSKRFFSKPEFQRKVTQTCPVIEMTLGQSAISTNDDFQITVAFVHEDATHPCLDLSITGIKASPEDSAGLEITVFIAEKEIAKTATGRHGLARIWVPIESVRDQKKCRLVFDTTV